MDLLKLGAQLVAIGFVVWLLTTQVSMPPTWARTIQVLALIAVVFYLLARFASLPNVLPR